MRFRYSELRPDQLLEKISDPSVALVPVGSMEWHGRHMNFGMDAMHAEKIAEKAAERTGAVVLPALYIGTEVERSRRQLINLGFEGNEHITGVDFPSNTVLSMYFSPSLLRALMEEEVGFLKRIGFHKIVIVNGHGADKQIEIFKDLAKRYSDEAATVVPFFCFSDRIGVDLGHACQLETSIMMAIDPGCVDKTKLPPRSVPLKITENGFFDGKAISGSPNAGHTVECDPRDATARLGELSMELAAEDLVRVIGGQCLGQSDTTI